MLMAVALAHLEDPENATAAYEQAVSLDPRDPAVPLNYAVFLAGQGDAVGAARQLRQLEQRTAALRETPGLDADPEVLATALQLAATIGYTLGISVNNVKPRENSKPRMSEREKEAKSRARAAKTAMKARTPSEVSVVIWVFGLKY